MATIRAAQQPLRTVAAALAGPSRVRLARAVPVISNSIIARSAIIPPQTSIVRAFASTSRLAASPAASTTTTSPSPQPSSSSSNSESDSTQSQSESEGGPEPESDGPPPKSAYARFKLLTKKYGWYALGMYTALSSVDFSLSFLLVHALGVERISPLFESGMYQYRRIRYGADEAARLGAEAREKARADKEHAEREVAEGKKAGGYWGSRTFWAELVLAYGIHKTALLPFRAGLTVAWTPKVVGWLTARGWIGKVSWNALRRLTSLMAGRVRAGCDARAGQDQGRVGTGQGRRAAGQGVGAGIAILRCM